MHYIFWDAKIQKRTLLNFSLQQSIQNSEFYTSLYGPEKILFIFDIFKFLPSVMSFLQKLATAIIHDNSIDFKDTAVILPNRRAVRLLRQAMAKEIGKPFFSPVFYTIDDFIETLSPIKKADNQTLLLHLYEVYKNMEKTESKSFFSFLSWGSIFIQDINEIDMQLANADDIFSNLADIKEIDNFFLKQQLSHNTLSYIEFYKSLKKLYHNYIQRLQEANIGYTGLIYKNVAEHITNYAQQLSHRRYIFAGFNMLSPSELTIAKYYKEQHSGEFYFDLDALYFNEDRNSSYMVQQMNATFNELGLEPEKVTWITDDYRNIPKKIYTTGTSKQINQVLYASELLEQMTADELDQTAVVLTDESLFLPFIHTYGHTHANFTMGYPLKATTAYSLLEIVISTALNSQRFYENQQNSTHVYYFRDLIAFFKNPIIQETLFSTEQQTSVIDRMITRNRTFFEYEEIPELELVNFPKTVPTGNDYFRHLLNFFINIAEKLPGERKDFYAIQYIINGLYQTNDLLNTFIQTAKELDLVSLEFILKEKLGRISIPIAGTPDCGLQIMGLLETRTLDFKNIIMLSVNEGILPKGKSHNSLILHNIKQHFNLPTYHYKDAVIAYHFFRLLQHAENIHLIYDNDSSNALSEKSRFIHQLDYEIKKRDLPISFIENTLTQKLAQHTSIQMNVPKDSHIISKIKALRFSPSSLNTYIACPLRFYLDKVANIKKPETINETIESSVIGNTTHSILEDLYNRLKNQPVQYRQTIQEYEDNIDEHLHSKFSENNFQKEDLSKGKLYLAYEVVKKYLLTYFKIIKTDFDNGLNDIIGTEIQLKTNICIGGNSLQLFGKSDRVDYRESCITIFDYKTGYVDTKNLKLKLPEEIDKLFTDYNYSMLFQLLMYAYLYAHDTSDCTKRKTTTFKCGIISFQELMKSGGEPILYSQLPEQEITAEILSVFEEGLKELLSHILDEKTPFQQTNQTKNCLFCDFNLLCKRQQTRDE